MDKMKRKHMPRSAGNVLFLRVKRAKFISAHSVEECVCRLNGMQGGSLFWGLYNDVKVDWIDKDTCSFRVHQMCDRRLGVEVQGQLSRYQDAESFIEYTARLTRDTRLVVIGIGMAMTPIVFWGPLVPAVAFEVYLGIYYLSYLISRNRLARDVENVLMR